MLVIKSFKKSQITALQETILEDLQQDGLVTEDDNRFLISFSQAQLISNGDRRVLEIPCSVPFPIFIESRGTLQEIDFHFNWYFFDQTITQPIQHSRESNIFRINQREYLPNNLQMGVIEILDSHKNLSVINYDSNLKILGKLKSLISTAENKSQVIFDRYLENENVKVAESIRLDFKENSDGTLSVLPSLEDEVDEQFKKSFDIYPGVKNVYNNQIDEKRIRVIIPEEKTAELKRLKKSFRKINGDLKDRVLRYPQEFFDESTFDLDHYSKRVYDIGYYEPKFYPFVKPFSTDWVSGITIEKEMGERSEVFLETDSEFNTLVNQIEIAEKKSIEKVDFKDYQIPLEDAISLRDSYLAIKEKRVNKSGLRDSKGRKVLIIYENIDELSYQENAISSIDHILELPKRLKREVKILDHQNEGIAWLQSLSKSSSGALLADDMGVGKSLQVLGFLDWSIDYQLSIGLNKPNLIVAPVTLLENWENEHRKFFIPYAKINRYYGSLINAINLDKLGRNDIILTTYETLRAKQIILGRVNWFAAVLDEAQRIKTPGTLVSRAAKGLNADFKVAMTGTPVENSWIDLWCITDFIASGLLGSGSDFNKKYNLILKNQSVDLISLGDEIRNQIGIYIKRRLKSQILKDLPEKKIFQMTAEMPFVQAKEYQNELNNYKINKANKNQILVTINNLRLISDHPFLIQSEVLMSDYSVQEIINSSAKLSQTVNLIEKIKVLNEKVILFSHFEKVQKILQQTVHDYFGVKSNIINGKTANIDSISKASRQKLIDRFQATEGFNVIIMSPIAAGYGLNVTGANHVIHYTRHWNPAKENQATDRVYRIGQDKPVSIYYPMATLNGKETFDQKIDKLLKMKSQLSEASLYPTEACVVKIIDFEDILN
ncbi:DEAD/DEAH box helicase [Peijinzhouia sedimentorum]